MILILSVSSLTYGQLGFHFSSIIPKAPVGIGIDYIGNHAAFLVEFNRSLNFDKGSEYKNISENDSKFWGDKKLGKDSVYLVTTVSFGYRWLKYLMPYVNIGIAYKKIRNEYYDDTHILAPDGNYYISKESLFLTYGGGFNFYLPKGWFIGFGADLMLINFVGRVGYRFEF